MNLVPRARISAYALATYASLAAASVALVGCADDLTQLVVVVNTDLAAGVELDAIAVDIDATSAGASQQRFEESLVGAGALRLPATLSVVSRGGSSGVVTVRAEALREGAVVLSREVIVRFVPGESRTVKLDLLSCCLGVTCADGQTCSDRGCIDREQRGVELPRWTGTAPPRATCEGGDAGSDMGAPQDAGVDANVDAGSDAGDDGCDPLHPPERPVMEDDGTGGERWYAFRSLDFGGAGGTRFGELGYDHDDLCTDLDSTVLACEPAPAFNAPSDGPRGVDNAFVQSLVPLFDLFAPGFFLGANVDLDRGRFGFLVRIVGWNGRADDPLVDVSIVDGVEGLRPGETLGDGGMVAEDARVPLPDGGGFTRSLAWDGTDRWYANESSFVAGDPDQAITRDRNGYVAGGLLVARTGRPVEFTLSAVDVSLALRLGAGTLFTARMVDGAHLMQGIVSGKWAVDDILDSVVTGFGLCVGTVQYMRTVDTLERVADLSVTGEPGTSSRCDAVSVGVGFEAVEIELAGLAPTVRRLIDCRSLDAGIQDGGVEAGMDAGVSFDAMPPDADGASRD